MGQGLKTLQRVLLGGDSQPLGDGGSLRYVVIAFEYERLDGLEAEDTVELGVQVLGNVVELHPLLCGHRLVVNHVLPFRLNHPTPFSSRLTVQGLARSPLDTCALTQAWAPICTASHGLPSGGV